MGRDEKKMSPAGLDRIFHEPSRLAIMTALCGAPQGMAFSELRRECGLTDGNLNRHLHTLQEAGMVRMGKGFVGARPRTTIWVTDRGREEFARYLESLEAMVQRALRATGLAAQPKSRPVVAGMPVQRITGGGR